MYCFLSAIGAPVKNCGMPGMKLTDQNQLSGENVRKNKILMSSCHSQGMESECLFPGPWQGPLPSCESLTPVDSRDSGLFRSAGQQTGVCGSSASA